MVMRDRLIKSGTEHETGVSPEEEIFGLPGIYTSLEYTNQLPSISKPN